MVTHTHFVFPEQIDFEPPPPPPLSFTALLILCAGYWYLQWFSQDQGLIVQGTEQKHRDSQNLHK